MNKKRRTYESAIDHFKIARSCAKKIAKSLTGNEVEKDQGLGAGVENFLNLIDKYEENLLLGNDRDYLDEIAYSSAHVFLACHEIWNPGLLKKNHGDLLEKIQSRMDRMEKYVESGCIGEAPIFPPSSDAKPVIGWKETDRLPKPILDQVETLLIKGQSDPEWGSVAPQPEKNLWAAFRIIAGVRGIGLQEDFPESTQVYKFEDSTIIPSLELTDVYKLVISKTPDEGEQHLVNFIHSYAVNSNFYMYEQSKIPAMFEPLKEGAPDKWDVGGGSFTERLMLKSNAGAYITELIKRIERKRESTSVPPDNVRSLVTERKKNPERTRDPSDPVDI